MILAEFNLKCTSQKAVKGQGVADMLAAFPIAEYQPIKTDFPDEELLAISQVDEKSRTWTLYFDGALNANGAGIGAALQTPEGITIPKAQQLRYPATNNVAEYEALIMGVRTAQLLGATHLKIIGDSQLVLRQILDTYRMLDPTLKDYRDIARALLKKFHGVTYISTPRSNNALADALATLASTIRFPMTAKEETVLYKDLSFQQSSQRKNGYKTFANNWKWRHATRLTSLK